MSPESSTESYPAFAHIGLRENPGKNLNQVTCPDRDSNPRHLVSRPDALTVIPQKRAKTAQPLVFTEGRSEAGGGNRNANKTADTSNYSLEEQLVESVWIHKRKHTGQTMRQIMTQFERIFGGLLKRKATLLARKSECSLLAASKTVPEVVAQSSDSTHVLQLLDTLNRLRVPLPWPPRSPDLTTACGGDSEVVAPGEGPSLSWDLHPTRVMRHQTPHRGGGETSGTFARFS
ncbi:hypothetical protein ANN_20000 [Periplaneta americana]|uniref:Uncharacterized protein n=1 Tax=Periplaneta americana TaxID=6978 RepID=A0ABQ8SBP0_PERAM|nr:hypothetical protein ANN_20000 [Periplaneta americana]